MDDSNIWTHNYDILYHIFSFLKQEDLANARLVHKSWKYVADDPLLYKRVSFKCDIEEDSFYHCLKFMDDKRAKSIRKLYIRLENGVNPYTKLLLPKQKSLIQKLHISVNRRYHDPCNVDDSLLEKIGETCPVLKELWIGNRRLCKCDTDYGYTDDGIESLVNGCPNLELIYLVNGNLDDDMLEHISKLKKLKVLNIGYISTSLKGIRALANRCKKLKQFHIYEIVDEDEDRFKKWDDLYEIVLARKKMKSFEIYDHKALSTFQARRLSECQELERLFIKTHRSSLDVLDFFSLCPKIQILSLNDKVHQGRYNRHKDQVEITDDNLFKITSNFPNIKVLNLFANLSPDGFKQLLHGLPNLREIHLRSFEELKLNRDDLKEFPKLKRAVINKRNILKVKSESSTSGSETD